MYGQTNISAQVIVVLAGDPKMVSAKEGSKPYLAAYGTCIAKTTSWDTRVRLKFFGQKAEDYKHLKSGDVVWATGSVTASAETSKAGKPYALVSINVLDAVDVLTDAEATKMRADQKRGGAPRAAAPAAKPATDGEPDEVPF